MNLLPSPTHFARLAPSVLIVLALLLMIPSELRAQAAGQPRAMAQGGQSQTAASPQPAAQQPATRNDDLTQMRTDLDRMESLLGNMSSEIEFLRDQNLQILLRTNAQMWTMLIRDLRRQVDREERARSRNP
jgi:TolA-binding protein